VPRTSGQGERAKRERKERLDTLYARARRSHQAQEWQAGYRGSQMGNTRGGNTIMFIGTVCLLLRLIVLASLGL
jgi:hypothetical protein